MDHQTKAPESDQPGPAWGAPPATSAYVDPMQVGPAIALPALRMLAAVLGAGAALALLGWPIAAATRAGSPAWMAAGVGGAVLAFLLGIAAIRPWRRMPIGRWLMAWMAHLGVCFVATVAIGALLLYSSPPDQRLTLGLALAVGHFGALMAESIVIASHFKSCRGNAATPPL